MLESDCDTHRSEIRSLLSDIGSVAVKKQVRELVDRLLKTPRGQVRSPRQCRSDVGDFDDVWEQNQTSKTDSINIDIKHHRSLKKFLFFFLFAVKSPIPPQAIFRSSSLHSTI